LLVGKANYGKGFMATLEEVLKENDARGICISEAALEAFYTNDAHYYATEEADNVCRMAEDALIGEFSSDEEFAQDMADNCGLMTQEAVWPYTCIDWEYAARELMYDYYENDGFYFRCV
jgi:antirestriction protein